MDITDIDVNLKVETEIQKEGIKFLNCTTPPFKIYGVFRENGRFRRIPEKVAESVSDGVLFLHTDTAGGRIRFKTNSPYVAIICDNGKRIRRMSHFAFTGSAGLDLYADNVFVKTFIPHISTENKFESIIEMGEKKERDITINLPLYSGVAELYIGLDSDSYVKEPTPYKNDKPIVYYGSSITQGGCASRPGMSYESIISRRFNCDFINLGFSGNAKGEVEITDYIKNLEMSLFVYDYDHNAPDADHLRDTHEKMFLAIREKHPTLPIVMATSPKFAPNDQFQLRRDIIHTTYKNALARGDRNVYFISGQDLMQYCENDGTVDGTHPTDFGFYSMAKAFGDLFEKESLI